MAKTRTTSKSKTGSKAPGKQARDQRIASRLMAGQSVTAIAAQEGLSRATASKAANSPEVQLLLTSLVEAEGGKIRGLFSKALDAIGESYTAERKAVFEGAVVDLGPDHYARLTGVKCLAQLLTAGRQAVKPEPPPKKTMSLDDLRRLVAEGKGAGAIQ